MAIQVTPIPRLTVLTVPAFTLGTANAAGSAITAIASNSTLLAFDAVDPAAVGAASSVGSATVAPRRDHVHAAATAPAFERVVLTSGNVTTTSTTLVDLTGAILTITTGAFPLLWTVAQCIQNSGANGQVFMNIELNNATLLLGTAGLTFHQHDTGGKRTIAGLSGQTAALSAQENILKVQWKVDGGTGTVFADSAISFMFTAAEVR
jgi:hypothetical protein